MVNDSVGGAILKLIIRESVREFGSLQEDAIGTPTSIVFLLPLLVPGWCKTISGGVNSRSGSTAGVGSQIIVTNFKYFTRTCELPTKTHGLIRYVK